jgi:hypothetical protein
MGGLTKSPVAEEVEKKSKYKRMLKKYGVWAIVFFCVKGIISLTLILLGIDSLRGCM